VPQRIFPLDPYKVGIFTVEKGYTLQISGILDGWNTGVLPECEVKKSTVFELLNLDEARNQTTSTWCLLQSKFVRERWLAYLLN